MRQWWIKSDYDLDRQDWFIPADVASRNMWEKKLEDDGRVVHVVEYDAFKKREIELECEIARLTQILMVPHDQSTGFRACYELMSAREDQIIEIHKDRITLLKERDQALARYRSIELANEHMSRNDHVHFGDLLMERDKWIEFANQHEKRIVELNAEVERLKGIVPVGRKNGYLNYEEEILRNKACIEVTQRQVTNWKAHAEMLAEALQRASLALNDGSQLWRANEALATHAALTKGDGE